MQINKKHLSTIAVAAMLPLKLLANDCFYFGVNGMGNYIMEDDYKFSTYELKVLTKNYNLNGTSIKTNSKFGGGASIVAGFMMNNFLHGDLELGVDMSALIDAKSTTIPFSTITSDGKDKSTTNGFIAANGIAGAKNHLTADSVINEKDLLKTMTIYGTLNGYVGIGSYGGFMPFVGAGAGIARYKIELSEANFTNSTLLFSNDATGPATAPTAADPADVAANSTKLNTILQDVDNTSAIINLTGGFFYQVSDSMYVGLGYRFTTSAGDLELEIDSSDNNSTSSSTKVKHHFMRHNLLGSIRMVL